MDTGTTAWILISATLVLLMTPGLAMFYGGMNRHRGVLNMMMMSFGALGLISVLWVLYGYSVAFGTSNSGFIGNFTEYWGFAGLMPGAEQLQAEAIGDVASGSYPDIAFAAFQGVFAVITVALISGAIADRAKFGSWMIFAGIWATVVYFPVAHWVFAFQDGEGGWIADGIEAIDLAGGTAVHINAGAAALALALVLGKRKGFGKEPMRPNNLPLVMLGAGLLWFGWFGFNGASFLTSDGIAAYVWVNTFVATGAAVLGWLVVEKLRDGASTSLGAASGVVAGLVAITPACGAVTPVGAIFIGLIAGVVCAFAVGLKYKLGFDDSLDVVGVHLVGGLVGTLLIVLFAAPSAAAAYDGYPAGLFYGGGLELLPRQAGGAFAVLAYSFVLAYLIGLLIEKTIGFRISEEAEAEGIDSTEHAEAAYTFSGIGTGGFAPKSATSSKTEVSA
ncbi:ammonium transporter [Aquipuribacter nitratireducens]|uniref:Ammonium transporter n=1 Tax=Aquipuribacter nitratireducens TaxID=650104 RepID=A0ABW0GLA6_9MICO